MSARKASFAPFVTSLALSSLALSSLALSGCGLASARSAQDWTAVTDPRLFRCCHVGNHGSGVLLLQDDKDLWILTNAHLVSRVAKVHVVDPGTRRWRETTAWVVASGHPFSEDFALLRAEPLPFLQPFVTRLASPLENGATRDVDLMPVSVRDTPRAYALPAVGRRTTFSNPVPARPPIERDMMCVHGGVQQANSGTPIFEGDRLVGLNELHPFDATFEKTAADGQVGKQRVVGIGASTPQAIEAFLRAHGHGALADRLVVDTSR